MLETLKDEELLAATRALVAKSSQAEAELLLHLGEIDERRLYLARAYPSMFVFCVEELRFSEDAAYTRILVARAARRMPALTDSLAAGTMHLAGLRLLVPHLTAENHRDLLARASGRSKRQIEEVIATLFPRPAVPTTIRKIAAPGPDAVRAEAAAILELPEQKPSSLESRPQSDLVSLTEPDQGMTPARRVPSVQPLSPDAFNIQFTASAAFRDKLGRCRALLGRRLPAQDLAGLFEAALDCLIGSIEKERFAVGRKARPRALSALESQAPVPATRHIPDGIKRAVYHRDGGRCSFTDDRGRRCAETFALEFDHIDGFARTRSHSVEGIRLLCGPHNQYAAEQLYGRSFMRAARRPDQPTQRSLCESTPFAGQPGSAPTCPGTSARGPPD